MRQSEVKHTTENDQQPSVAQNGFQQMEDVRRFEKKPLMTKVPEIDESQSTDRDAQIMQVKNENDYLEKRVVLLERNLGFTLLVLKSSKNWKKKTRS